MQNLIELFNRPLLNTDLHEKFNKLSKQSSTLRRREVAETLDISESEVIDNQLGVLSVRLAAEFPDMIKYMPELGYVMSLTRNDYAVHERKGVFQNVTINGSMGLVIGDDKKIDLRLFLSRWKYGFAVCEQVGKEYRFSLQFFDQSGTSIQKIFLQKNSSIDGYKKLVDNFSVKDQSLKLMYSNIDNDEDFSADSDVDKSLLFKDWEKMKDVHQFFGIIRKHKVTREQAFKLVGSEYAVSFDVNNVEHMLTTAAANNLSIMCFVGSYGNIQIHTGVVKNIKVMGPWLNVLDSEFNLHLLQTGIKRAWVVRKPTVDGLVTSIELYDESSNLVVQFFGERKEGNSENLEWKSLAESLVA